MLAWLTETVLGKLLQTFFLSMVPVAELRAGIPYGVHLGLEYHAAAAAAILGNLFPVPVIIIYVKRVFAWLRKKTRWLDDWISGMERKGLDKEKNAEDLWWRRSWGCGCATRFPPLFSAF